MKFSRKTNRRWPSVKELLFGNMDGDGDDIQPFVDILTTGQRPTQAVPEPATLSLLAIGGLALIRRSR